jgi:1-aminocyclopropane-1-carboxylate deaminase
MGLERTLDIEKERIPVNKWETSLFSEKNVRVNVLRLDLIHPIISGNKWFKLKYYLEDAIGKRSSGLLTMGGAYSNLVLAAAYAARESGLRSIGIIRGERPLSFSRTLLDAADYGMQFEFISRDKYKTRNEPGFREWIAAEFPGFYWIPEGGSGYLGIKGSEEILKSIDSSFYSHILCAVGTGTQFLGLARACNSQPGVIGICVLKGIPDQLSQSPLWISDPSILGDCKILSTYHFGGYAKRTSQLLDFMNKLYLESGIPTDFVYTGKLFFAASDLVRNDHFPEGSNLLIIHSGGLQGNRSLPEGSLIY